MKFNNSGSFFGIALPAATIGLFFAGLWPFVFSPQNRAFWVAGRRGLYFDGARRPLKLSAGGLAYFSFPEGSGRASPADNRSFTISIHLLPAQDNVGGVPQFLSLAEASGREALSLGQYKQNLIVRWSGFETGGGRKPGELSVGGALLQSKPRWITIVSDQGGAVISLDGETAGSFPGTTLLSEGRSIRDFFFVLGNSPNAANPWTGTILDLALYDRPLSENKIFELWKRSPDGFNDPEMAGDGLIAAYRFDGGGEGRIPDLSGKGNGLMVPARITVRKKMLEWPETLFQDRAWAWKDILVNVLGFFPFGFVFLGWIKNRGRWNRERSCLFVLLMGGLVSFGIEAAQSLMPARDSSLADLLCNVLGTLLGIVGFKILEGAKARQGLADG